MIQLTRLRHGDPFFVNPDLIERVDTHVDTIVRLTSGTEFVVEETGHEIIRLIAEFRARVIALAGLFQESASTTGGPDSTPAEATTEAPDTTGPIAEIGGVDHDAGDVRPDQDSNEGSNEGAPFGAPSPEGVLS